MARQQFYRERQQHIDAYQNSIDSKALLNRYEQNIPQPLKECQNWQFWKALPKGNEKIGFKFNEDTGELEFAKPPFSPLAKDPYKTCSGTDPELFMNFKQAMLILDEDHFQKSKFYSGLMFNVTPNDPFVLIDLDHCFDPAGNLTKEAAEVVNLFGSYTEISQSGNGVHIIVWDPGFKENRNAGGYEIYGSAGRLAMTGNLLRPDLNQIQNSHEEIQKFYKKHIGERKQDSFMEANSFQTREDSRPENKFTWAYKQLADEEVIRLAESSDNTGRFKQYFHMGLPATFPAGHDRAGEEDLSGSMQGLANILAFFCGNPQGRDLNQIDRLMRKSALFEHTESIRAKWDAQKNHGTMGGQVYSTWGQMTVCNAVMGLKSFFGSDLKKTTGESLPSDPVVWGELIPLSDSFSPEFPINSFPEPYRTYCIQKAESMCQPVDQLGVAMLGGISAAISKVFKIEAGGKEEHTNLFLLLAADPSEKKSSSLDAVQSLIYSFQNDINDDLKPLREGIKSQMDIETIQIQGLKRTIANAKNELLTLDQKPRKAKKGEQPESKEEAEKKLKDLIQTSTEEMDRLSLDLAKLSSINTFRCYLASSGTAEGIRDGLLDCNEKISIFSDEGGLFKALSGMYAKGGQTADTDVIKKSWDGSPYIALRAGKRIPLREPISTICLYVQPHVVKQVINNTEWDEEGLCARFLFSKPNTEDPKYRKRLDAAKVNPEIRKAVEDHYRTIINFTDLCLYGQSLAREPVPSAPDQYVMRLSEDGYKLFKQYYDQLEDRAWEDPVQKASYRKHAFTTLRIIACLHVMENGYNVAFTPVTAETVKKGIDLGEYFLEGLFAVKGTAGGRTRIGAERILKAIQKFKGSPVSIKARDILQKAHDRKTFKTFADLEPSFNFLIERGYIYPDEESRAAAYLINPEVYKLKL